MFADDAKEKVRDAVDMLALVGARVDLSRKGSDSYFGRCPFHDERTASFHVQPSLKRYYCFGCQAKGDPFSWVMETEGASFPEALELLAERFGVPIEPAEEDPEAKRRRVREKKLLEALERAATFYARRLWESPEAAESREYLLGRGLTEETLRAYRVGYAPEGDRLVGASLRAGFSSDELLAAGLAVARGGRLRDRFFARITFPLADDRGRVRGFGARATRAGQEPKYLNSSENEVFHKGRQLFGVAEARRAAAAAGRVVLAEGYTDVLALRQAGVENAVGLMGTALTEEQVGVLARTAPTLLLALDADKAGQAAMLKAADVAARQKLELRVVPLPEGLDPADVLAHRGPEPLREAVERSVPFVVFRVERELAAADLGSAEGRDRALERLKPIIRPMAPSVLREELVQRIAGTLAIGPELTAVLIGERAQASRARPAPGRGSEPPPLPSRLEGERDFLVHCLRAPGEAAAQLSGQDLDALFTLDVHARAARLLVAHPADPLGAADRSDEELLELLADLRRREGSAPPGSLEYARISLELAALGRAEAAARAANSFEITELSRRRNELRERLGVLEPE